MTSLNTTLIGSTPVTTIGYGAMGIGGRGFGSPGSDEERFKVLDRLYELGERNIDTARVYGDSEELIGKWLKRTPGLREQLFIATKCGILPDGDVRGDPESIRPMINQSFERLGVDKIDLLYQHRPDPKVPIEITVRTLAEYVKEGKVTHIGLSECQPSDIRRAHKIHPIAAVQIEYSPLELSHGKPGGVIETCKELGIAIVAFSPTGKGILTGQFRSPEDFPEGDVRRILPRFNAENFPKVLKAVEALKEIGAAHNNATPAQVAIAWVAAQGIIVIPGSKKLKYAEENLGADSVKLSEEEVNTIRRVGEETNWTESGPRYWEQAEAAVHVETPALDA